MKCTDHTCNREATHEVFFNFYNKWVPYCEEHAKNWFRFSGKKSVGQIRRIEGVSVEQEMDEGNT